MSDDDDEADDDDDVDALVVEDKVAVDEAVENEVASCSSSHSMVNDIAVDVNVDTQLSIWRPFAWIPLIAEPTSVTIFSFLFCCRCVLLLMLLLLGVSIFKKSSKCKTATQGLISSDRGARVVPEN